jgi:hypothetical protein
LSVERGSTDPAVVAAAYAEASPEQRQALLTAYEVARSAGVEVQTLARYAHDQDQDQAQAGAAKDFSRLFAVFGCSLRHTGPGSAEAEECPYCGRAGFVLDGRTGRHHCRECLVKGNAYTFIGWIHRECLKATTDADYRRLADRRGLAALILKLHALAWCPGLGCWFVPFKSARGEVVNLERYWEWSGHKYFLPCLDVGLFGLDTLAAVGERSRRTLLVTEGPWDFMAADEHLRAAKVRTRHDLLALPAAQVFRPAWLAYLTGYREVKLCLDNDAAGAAGMAKVARLAWEAQADGNLYALNWPEGYAEGADLADLVRSGASLVRFLRENSVAVAGREVA